MISETLKSYKPFQELPIHEQTIYLALAEHFETLSHLSIYLTPRELQEKLQVGNIEQWTQFLQFEPVRVFIRQETTSQLQVSQRKAIKAMSESAAKGDVQAARQVQELSGILRDQDDSKVIILHRIERPTIKEVAE